MKCCRLQRAAHEFCADNELLGRREIPAAHIHQLIANAMLQGALQTMHWQNQIADDHRVHLHGVLENCDWSPVDDFLKSSSIPQPLHLVAPVALRPASEPSSRLGKSLSHWQLALSVARFFKEPVGGRNRP